MAVDWQLLSHVDPQELDEIQADDVSQHLLEVITMKNRYEDYNNNNNKHCTYLPQTILNT